MSNSQSLLAVLMDEYGGTVEDWTGMGSLRRVMRVIEGFVDIERERTLTDAIEKVEALRLSEVALNGGTVGLGDAVRVLNKLKEKQ